MTDTTSQVAMRPPRIEEGYGTPTPRRRSGFLGTARAMAGPAVEAARENLEASRAGVGDYFLNMPLAALNLADAGFRGGVGAFADLIPGLRPAQRMDLAREVAAVPEAMAGSIARAPEALDEGIGALSEVARRMFQEGPMPETLYSNPRFDDIIRGIGRARDNARRADSPNPDLVPRTADPDVALSDFARARERMLGASNDLSFGELQGLIDAQAAARRGVVEALSGEPSVRLFNRNDRAAVVGPGMGPGEEGRFRVTYFDADRQPTNHTVFETKEEALGAALREGFDSRTAAPKPREFGFTRDNPGGDWLRNKQQNADEAMAESSRGLRRRGVTGSVTGTMGMQTDMFLPTDRLSSLTGLMDENRRPGDLQFDELMARVRKEGFDPDQAGNRIVIAVNHRGEPFVLEGNTRIAVARELGIPNVKAEVRYWNGAEDVDGPFAPRNIARIAARGPEGFAQGGEVMMRSNMPEQLHRGIGSLSGVARGMYRGGEVQGFQMGGAVGGHPLDQYGQYLNQRYAEPVQQLAANAVGQFVDSVRQKEQNYFGGGAMGGGGLMGSPMQQPGGMQMAAFNAAQARNPAPAPNPSDPYGGVLEAHIRSPFGNNLGNQQMFAQQRMNSLPGLFGAPAAGQPGSPGFQPVETMSRQDQINYYSNSPGWTTLGDGSFQNNTFGNIFTVGGGIV
jgi:hypothetical protein